MYRYSSAVVSTSGLWRQYSVYVKVPLKYSITTLLLHLLRNYYITNKEYLYQSQKFRLSLILISFIWIAADAVPIINRLELFFDDDNNCSYLFCFCVLIIRRAIIVCKVFFLLIQSLIILILNLLSMLNVTR